MNKYLKDYEEIIKDLSSKEKNTSGYSYFIKMEIADNLDTYYIQDNYSKIKLNENEQEKMTNIIYNYYMELDDDISIYKVVKAVCDTLDIYESYESFENKYNNEYNEFIMLVDEFIE